MATDGQRIGGTVRDYVDAVDAVTVRGRAEEVPGAALVCLPGRLRNAPVFAYGKCRGLTLVELLVVVSVLALLISSLLPSMIGARQQSKQAHCLARLKDLGRCTVEYAGDYGGVLPPALLPPDAHPTIRAYYEETGLYVGYAWAELLFEHVNRTRLDVFARYPVQRNFDDSFPRFATCGAASRRYDHAGHYRVYIPGWCFGTQGFDEEGRLVGAGSPMRPASLSVLNSGLVLMGDSEEESECGDGLPFLGEGDLACGSVCLALESSFIGDHACPCSSIIPPTVTANRSRSSAGIDFTPNRFSDRHRGGTNYLFGDFHAEYSKTLRKRLGCDANLDGICDIGEESQREIAGCEERW